MRFLLVIALSVIFNFSWAQLNPNQIKFGQIKYDFLNQQLTQQDLEEILNTFSSLGDKEIVFEEVVKSFFVQTNTSFSDSLIDYWLNDFNYEDSLKLTEIPPIKPDFRERAFNMVFLTYFAKAYLEDISLIEAHIVVQQQKPNAFPNLPEMGGVYSGITDAIHNLYIYSKWYLSHPKEYQYFEDLMKSYVVQKMGSYSIKNLEKFINIVVKDVKDRRLIYESYLPLPLTEFLEYRAIHEANKSNQNNDLNNNEIKALLQDGYQKLYNETLSDEALTSLMEYVETNKINDPKVIYLALIFSRYE